MLAVDTHFEWMVTFKRALARIHQWRITVIVVSRDNAFHKNMDHKSWNTLILMNMCFCVRARDS